MSHHAATDGMAPYARKYQKKHGSVPWSTLLSLEVQNSYSVPWLSLLPPEAKGSLHEWGRYLFSQTPACKRGSVNADMYGEWVLDTLVASKRTSAADTLIKCCAAFAYSPLSVIMDMRAAVQCISLATKQLLAGSKGATVLPSDVEAQLDHVCAAGCGKDLSQGHTHIPQYGNTLKYCSDECADKHIRRLPEALKIYLCWPRCLCDHPYVSTLLERMRQRRPTDQAELLLPSNEIISYVSAYLARRPDLEDACTVTTLRTLVKLLKGGLPAGHTCGQSFDDMVQKFKSGKVNGLKVYAALTTILYQNEHAYPGFRECFPNMLPPRQPEKRQPSSGSVNDQPVVNAAPTITSEPTAPAQPISHPSPPHTGPCTTVQRLTEADLARLSDLARDAWADASHDARPMLWHVRRRAYERVCARMGLPAAGVQSLLWVASERGDAWGGLRALYDADPKGLCLPPELRMPFDVWVMVVQMTRYLWFYMLGEEALGVLVEANVRKWSSLTLQDLCAVCGRHRDVKTDPSVCLDCDMACLCSEECKAQHKESGICKLLIACWNAGDTWADRSRVLLPLSFFSLPTHTAHTASDQQAPHTSDPTPHPSSPLQRDASAAAGCPAAAAAVPAPSRSVGAQSTHKPVNAAQALAAEYRQCVEGNPLLQRVAEVVMPRGAEREPGSAAVMAAQQLLIAASGLLDARDLEEVLAAAGA